MTDKFRLETFCPGGCHEWEYTEFFALDDQPSAKWILDFGGGPSSFNAERTARGGSVVTVDPLFQFDSADINGRLIETRHAMAGRAARRMLPVNFDRHGRRS